jgi:hypothetical protein
MTLAATVNLNAATPAPASGRQNVVFADDAGSPTVNISAIDPLMVGDTGSGGIAGNVPAPPAGSAAANTFLSADGTFKAPGAAGVTPIALTPSAGGNFTVAHGLGTTPTAVAISMTSSGAIWLQYPTGFDATNLYLVASDGPLTGTAICFT